MVIEAFFWRVDRSQQEPLILRRSSIVFGDKRLGQIGSVYKVWFMRTAEVSFQAARRLLEQLQCRYAVSQSFMELRFEAGLFHIFFYGFQSFPQRLFLAVHREARLFGSVPFRRLLPERLEGRMERWI